MKIKVSYFQKLQSALIRFLRGSKVRAFDVMLYYQLSGVASNQVSSCEIIFFIGPWMATTIANENGFCLFPESSLTTQILILKGRTFMRRVISLPIITIPKMILHDRQIRRAVTTIREGLNIKWSRFHRPLKIVASMALQCPFVKLGKVFAFTVLSGALFSNIPKILSTQLAFNPP